MMTSRSRTSRRASPSPAPRERVASEASRVRVLPPAPPSPSPPCGRVPSLSRDAGEGLMRLVDAPMAVEVELAPMGVAVGEIDRERARRGRPAATDLVLAELEAIGQQDA